MKHIIFIAILIVFTSWSPQNTKNEKRMKSLILYYSITGNTERTAKLIANEIDADLIKINADMTIFKNAYAARKTIKLELSQKTNYKEYFENIDLSAYDMIYLGSPCWYYTYVPAIQQFFDYANYHGKQITLFLTHGGDYGKTEEELIKNGKYASKLNFIEIYFRRKKLSDENLSNLIKSKLTNNE